MAGIKRAASILLMLIVLVWATGAKPSVTSAAEPPRAVAAAAGLPESVDVHNADTGEAAAASPEFAGEADVSTPESEPSPEYVPEVQAEEAAVPDPALAQAGGASAGELALKAIALPDIASGAPAPAQIKSLPASGMVCLTFDDGYSASAIQTILGCLREHDVQCTFFIIGACLKLYPHLWQQAAEDGHEIAYHTINHRPLTRRTNAQIVADINAWNQTAANVLGLGYRIPKIARAPGGTTDTRVRRLFDSLGYSLIYWSCDTFTGVYRSNHTNAGARAAAYILRHAAVGAISLQHFNAYDAASVSRYIGEMKARFRLGTVSEALAAVEMNAHKKALAETLKQRNARPGLCAIC